MVWACASILHLTLEELKPMLVKIAHALKENGIFYTTFKYVEFEGMKNGRCFTYMTTEKFPALLDKVNVFKIEEEWIDEDARADRAGESWLSVILRKKEN